MGTSKVTLQCVQAALRRIRGHGPLLTPILTSQWVNNTCGVSAHFKCEHLQPTGSFKIRGATHAVLSLTAETAKLGVVAHSAGNHGAALAAAAASRHVPCTVVVPNDTPIAKVRNMERYGATVKLCEPTQQARTKTATAEAVRMGGATQVHPYDDRAVIAGQGTLCLELVEQCPRLDAILVPTSGGGMLAGIVSAASELDPELRIVACEPAGKGLGEALSSGRRIFDPGSANQLISTVADAMRTKALGSLPWDIVQSRVEPTVLSVTDAEITRAMRLALVELKQVVEPAGAVTLAALLSPKFASFRAETAAKGKPLQNVAAILCGGNVGVDAFIDFVQRGGSSDVSPRN